MELLLVAESGVEGECCDAMPLGLEPVPGPSRVESVTGSSGLSRSLGDPADREIEGLDGCSLIPPGVDRPGEFVDVRLSPDF